MEDQQLDQVINIVHQTFFPGVADNALNADKFNKYLDATIQVLQNLGAEPSQAVVAAKKDEIQALVDIDAKVNVPKVEKSKKISVFLIGMVCLLLALSIKKIGWIGAIVIVVFGFAIAKGDKYIAKLNL